MSHNIVPPKEKILKGAPSPLKGEVLYFEFPSLLSGSSSCFCLFSIVVCILVFVARPTKYKKTKCHVILISKSIESLEHIHRLFEARETWWHSVGLLDGRLILNCASRIYSK